ncbi:alpha/beta hydrolase [Nonomuraea sp. NPDC005692]|uniref:alpha/beta hydrolase n=1 Tax=Nonomuraea sp. NPDC005692 TaxID=3157168 RepID=UPI0033F891B4
MIPEPDVDRAYNVRATVPARVFDENMRLYRTLSGAAVAGLRGHANLVYDRPSGERLDVWGVGDRPRPVFVFVHGGYWRALSRQDSAFMARMLDANGIATVAVDYTLAPGAPLEEIVRQVRAAVAFVHREGDRYGLDPARVVVGGSSAGGHLTGMLMLDDWQEALGLPQDVVKAALPISGLFDIRPLVRSFANEWLGLDDVRAADLSPALRLPGRRPPAVFAVAEHDGSGFLDQSTRFQRDWGPGSALLVVPDVHHYDIVLELTRQDSVLSRALLDLFTPLRRPCGPPVPQMVDAGDRLRRVRRDDDQLVRRRSRIRPDQ